MTQVPLRAESYGREPTALVARVTDYDRAARARRAAAIFFPLLGAAILSVPIPGWHFAAVPGFALAALVLGARRLRQAQRVESVEGPCPACGKAERFGVPERSRFPLTLRCPGCGEFLQLRELR